MKMKILITSTIFVALLATLGLIYFYVNRVEKIEVKNGRFFDDSGKQLGLCKIESKLKYLADMPEYTTYYYDSNKNESGHCRGDGTGGFVSLKEMPAICDPVNFQKTCDKSTYPVGFCARATYKCVLNLK